MLPLAGRRVRHRSLDGLRGVAALVVVLGHVLPKVSVFDASDRHQLHASGWAWWATNTPLRILWNGSFAVLVFFVLSGFVLVTGLSRGPARWLAYYPARLVRLYLPVAASLALAFVLVHTVHAWVPTTLRSVVRDLALVRGVDGLNPPLWSLQWEVLFSLLLPLYVAVARWRADLWPVKGMLLIASTWVGYDTGHASLVCLPVFAIGALLAIEFERGRAAGAVVRLDPAAARVLVPAAALLTVVAVNAQALVAAASDPGRSAQVAAATVEVLGAFGVVAFAVYARPVRALLERPSVQWLGSRSFSLYLVHYPLLAVIAHVVGGAGRGTAALVAIPLSLLLAELFFRGCERPAHRLSRRVARAAREYAARRPVAAVAA